MDASGQGRISKQAATGSIIALFILAVGVYVFRTFVRWHYRKLAWLDDGFLAFAVVCMAVSFGLWFGMVDNLYKTEALIYDPFASAVLFGNIIQIAIDVQIYTTTYIAISITGIFAVKFSFLFFFRSLISRLRPMVLYWRFAVAYTAFAWALSVGISFAACTYFDSRAVNCAQGNMLQRALDVSIVLLVFDVSSDTLIISIPLIVLRKVRIPLRSKLYLIFSFCLSAVMIACAILQGATLITDGVAAIDVVWQIYFQLIEMLLAITVVSLTAFRTFFLQRGSRNNTPRSPQNPKWYSYKRWKKSVSDRTTSTGFTGFSEYSQEMQHRSAPGRPEARPATTQPEPTGILVARSPIREPEPIFSPAGTEKGPPPSYNSASDTSAAFRSPISREPIERPSREASKTASDIPASHLPTSREPPELPVLQHTDSAESSDTDIGIPIQGSEPPSSHSPILTPAPTLVSPLVSRNSQDLDRNRAQEQSLHPPSDPPHLSSSNTISNPSTSLRSRTPPPPKHFSSASSGPRPALMGPRGSGSHTSRSDSMARPPTASSGLATTAEEDTPSVPALPHLQSGRPFVQFARGVPTRKPLPAPLTFPREPPPPPILSSPSSPPADLSSPARPSSLSTTTPSTSTRSRSPNRLRRSPQHPSYPRNNQPPQPIVSPTSSLPIAPRPVPTSTPYQPGTTVPATTPTSATTTLSPRAPRSNLSPDLRISGVQRAIRSGIERAMSFEVPGGEGEKW